MDRPLVLLILFGLLLLTYYNQHCAEYVQQELVLLIDQNTRKGVWGNYAAAQKK